MPATYGWTPDGALFSPPASEETGEQVGLHGCWVVEYARRPSQPTYMVGQMAAAERSQPLEGHIWGRGSSKLMTG